MTRLPPDTQEHLSRYLLGYLGEDEATVVEVRYFQDDEYFARLEVAADDLADRYVRGGLSGDDRARFERHCLGSPDDRFRLRVAEALRRHAHRLAPAQQSFLESLADFWRSRMFMPLVPAVASFALIVAVMVLSFLMADLRRDRNRLAADLGAQREAARIAELAVQQERAARERLTRQLSDLTTIAFTLVPGLDRGSSADLEVPRGAGLVRFDLAFDRSVSPGRFLVTIRTAERKTVWSQEVDAIGAQVDSLSITIPASVLAPAQYEIVMSRANPSGATDLATFVFRVSRPL